MMVRSSRDCGESELDEVNRLVTAAFMEVSGVRKSCVTESSSADFSRSPCLSASVCPSCSTANGGGKAGRTTEIRAARFRHARFSYAADLHEGGGHKPVDLI